MGTATLMELPRRPPPQWLVGPASSNDGPHTVSALPASLRRCGELFQSAFSKPKSGEHLYHTRTILDATHGVSELMVDCIRIHMSFNNISHLKMAVAEGAFIIRSQEVRNSFRREQNILRQQIAATTRAHGTAVRVDDWPGTRRWRYAVEQMQFAERVAKTDRAVYHSISNRCAAFAQRLTALARAPSTDGSSDDDQIGILIDTLQEEAAVEDDDGGVSIEAVASSLLARWVAKEHKAARACEEEMSARLTVAEEMLQVTARGGGVGESPASNTDMRGNKAEL